MKSSDLRIGNYVRIKNTSDIVCVSAITKRKIGFHAPGERPDAQLRYRKLSEIEGVLIRDVYFKLPGIAALTWDDRTDDVYCYGHGSATYDYICIGFLHELQNIHFALTGEEIEIPTFKI